MIGEYIGFPRSGIGAPPAAAGGVPGGPQALGCARGPGEPAIRPAGSPYPRPNTDPFSGLALNISLAVAGAVADFVAVPDGRRNTDPFSRGDSRQAHGGELVDVHVQYRGPDGRLWIDGEPDEGQPLRKRCALPSCHLPRTDYPGHLCLQQDGSEEWRDWL